MFRKLWYLQMNQNNHSSEQTYLEQPDIQRITDKHQVGRHDLIFIAAQVARVLKITPKSALLELETVENLEDYLISLKFKEND